MNTRLMMLPILIAYLSFAASAIAQAIPVEQNESEPEVSTAQMLLGEIQSQELALYELYNSLNSSDEFDVSCRNETSRDADIALQLCTPVFLSQIRQQVNLELERGASADSGLFSQFRHAFVSKDKRREELVQQRSAASIQLMQQEIEILASGNAQLAKQIQTIGDLQQAYLAAVERTNSERDYLVRQNDPDFKPAFSAAFQTSSPRPWLSTPPPGHTQPRIHYPADSYRGSDNLRRR